METWRKNKKWRGTYPGWHNINYLYMWIPKIPHLYFTSVLGSQNSVHSGQRWTIFDSVDGDDKQPWRVPLCHGHISCDALPDELLISFVCICIYHPVANQPQYDGTMVVLGNLGIAGFHYCLKIFWASPMSYMQMRHHEHFPKPSGTGSQRWGVKLRRQACHWLCDVSRPGGASGTSETLWQCPNCWAMVVRWVDDGTQVALRCSFHRGGGCSVTPCHRPMSAAAVMLSWGWHLCQWSVWLSASGASASFFLGDLLGPFNSWQRPSSYTELCSSWKTSWKFLVLTLLCLIIYCAFVMHGWTPLYVLHGHHRVMAAVSPPSCRLRVWRRHCCHRNVGRLHWRHRGVAPQQRPDGCWHVANVWAIFACNEPGAIGRRHLQIRQAMKLFNFLPKSPDGT